MIADSCRDNLIAIAAAYGQATGVSLEQISKKFYGNRAFLREFRRRERSVSIDKFDEMIAAFAAVWPEGQDWPLMRAAVIHRPRKMNRGKRKISPSSPSSLDANRLNGSGHVAPGRRKP